MQENVFSVFGEHSIFMIELAVLNVYGRRFSIVTSIITIFIDISNPAFPMTNKIFVGRILWKLILICIEVFFLHGDSHTHDWPDVTEFQWRFLGFPIETFEPVEDLKELIILFLHIKVEPVIFDPVLKSKESNSFSSQHFLNLLVEYFLCTWFATAALQSLQVVRMQLNGE